MTATIPEHKRTNASGASISRLLITRHDKIGDFVLALPLCKAIKTEHPEIQISVLVAHVNYKFAREVNFIDDVILYDENSNEMLANIKDRQFDASISCFIDTKLGYLLWRAGIPLRISPATKLAQLFFNSRINQRRSQVRKTEWQYNLELGRSLLRLKDPALTAPLIQFETLIPRNRVVFHPGFGGSSDGNLNIKDYLYLAKRASQVPGMEVAFTFGPDDQKTFHQIKSVLDFPATLILSEMSLMEFCKFLAQSRLLISTSTGPMHLAGAVNSSTISFFGESLFASSKRWATVSNPTRQHNFMIGKTYSKDTVFDVERAMLDVLTRKHDL